MLGAGELLAPRQIVIPRGIPAVVPGQPLGHEDPSNAAPIGQDDLGDDATVTIGRRTLFDANLPPSHEGPRPRPSLLRVGLALLGAIDTVEANMHEPARARDQHRVAVKDALDDTAPGTVAGNGRDHRRRGRAGEPGTRRGCVRQRLRGLAADQNQQQAQHRCADRSARPRQGNAIGQRSPQTPRSCPAAAVGSMDGHALHSLRQARTLVNRRARNKVPLRPDALADRPGRDAAARPPEGSHPADRPALARRARPGQGEPRAPAGKSAAARGT